MCVCVYVCVCVCVCVCVYKTPDHELIAWTMCALHIKTRSKNRLDEEIKPYCAFGFSSFDRYCAKA